MVSMKKLMLGAALVAGGLGLGATHANAARIRFGVSIGGPVAYVPPSPGPGYVWVDGYYSNGYWVPGFWRAPAVGFGFRVGGPHYVPAPIFRGHPMPERGFRR